MQTMKENVETNTLRSLKYAKFLPSRGQFFLSTASNVSDPLAERVKKKVCKQEVKQENDAEHRRYPLWWFLWRECELGQPVVQQGERGGICQQEESRREYVATSHVGFIDIPPAWWPHACTYERTCETLRDWPKTSLHFAAKSH